MEKELLAVKNALFKKWAYEIDEKLDSLYSSTNSQNIFYGDNSYQVLNEEAYLEYIDIIKKLNSWKSGNQGLKIENDQKVVIDFLCEKVILDMCDKDDSLRKPEIRFNMSGPNNDNAKSTRHTEKIEIGSRVHLDEEELVNQMIKHDFEPVYSFTFCVPGSDSITLSIDSHDALHSDIQTKLYPLSKVSFGESLKHITDFRYEYVLSNYFNHEGVDRHLINTLVESLDHNRYDKIDEYCKKNVHWEKITSDYGFKSPKYEYEIFAKIFNKNDSDFINEETKKYWTLNDEQIARVRNYYNPRNDLIMDLRIAQDIGLENEGEMREFLNRISNFVYKADRSRVDEFLKVYDGSIPLESNGVFNDRLLSLVEANPDRAEEWYSRYILINSYRPDSKLIYSMNNALDSRSNDDKIKGWNKFVSICYDKLTLEEKDLLFNYYKSCFKNFDFDNAVRILDDSKKQNFSKEFKKAIIDFENSLLAGESKDAEFVQARKNVENCILLKEDFVKAVDAYNNLFFNFAVDKECSSIIAKDKDKVVSYIFDKKYSSKFVNQISRIEFRSEVPNPNSNLFLSSNMDSVTFYFDKDSSLELDGQYLKNKVFLNKSLLRDIGRSINEALPKNNLYIVNEFGKSKHINDFPIVFEGKSVDELLFEKISAVDNSRGHIISLNNLINTSSDIKQGKYPSCGLEDKTKNAIIKSEFISLSDKINVLSNANIKEESTRNMFYLSEGQENKLYSKLKTIEQKFEFYNSRDFVKKSTENKLRDDIEKNLGDKVLSFGKTDPTVMIETINLYEGLPLVKLSDRGTRNLLNTLPECNEFKEHGSLGLLKKMSMFDYESSALNLIKQKIDNNIKYIDSSLSHYKDFDAYTTDIQLVCENFNDEIAKKIVDKYYNTFYLFQNDEIKKNYILELAENGNGRLSDFLRDKTGIQKKVFDIDVNKNEEHKEDDLSILSEKVILDGKLLGDIIGTHGLKRDMIDDYFTGRDDDR